VRRFNHLYGEVFPEPETLLTETYKIFGTDGRKMSKSYNNAIFPNDPPEVVEKKMLTMMTDPARKRRSDSGSPDICPLFLSYRVIYSDEETLAWVREGCATAGIGCIECKKSVIPKVLARLEPIRKKRGELEDEEGLVETILREGEERALAVAASTMEEARRAMKLST
ncbi:MAG: tryptophan--tRNA ligase, partial [Thermodesulfobacteriota bacterium]